MKKIVLFNFIFLYVYSLTFAVELSYQWKPGMSYRFKMNAKDDVAIQMDMLGMAQETKVTYLTETTLKLEITKVDANGMASGFLYVESFNVKDAKGINVAGMETIPAKALKAEVSVDKKGNFTFYKKVYILVQEKGNSLVSAKVSADGTSASGTGRVGNTEVTLYAQFDPKTGSLKAGYTQNSVSTPVVKKVETKAEDNAIDIIPYQVLDLLALPEGETQQGDETSVTAGFYNIKILTKEVTGTTVKIENTISTNKNSSAATQKVNTNTSDGSMNMDMNGMGDMSGFDNQMETPMEGSGGMTPKDMMPETAGKINVTFNTAKGMFDKLDGTMETTQKMSGLKIATRSNLKLVLLAN